MAVVLQGVVVEAVGPVLVCLVTWDHGVHLWWEGSRLRGMGSAEFILCRASLRVLGQALS